MSTDIIATAWADPIFRSELPEEERVSLPDNPAGHLNGFPPDQTTPNCNYSYESPICPAYSDDCSFTVFSNHPCCD